jgi:hypothetical protein
MRIVYATRVKRNMCDISQLTAKRWASNGTPSVSLASCHEDSGPVTW